jgi:hypothetical protein
MKRLGSHQRNAILQHGFPTVFFRGGFNNCFRRRITPSRQAGHPLSHRGVDLISDAPTFGRLWYGEPDAIANAIGYAKHRSRSHDAVIRVYDDAGNVIETHENTGESKRRKVALFSGD